MEKVTKEGLKGNDPVEVSEEYINEKLTKEFVDYLQKARKIVGKKYKHESDIDSEVSLHMRSMLDQFDEYRTKRV